MREKTGANIDAAKAAANCWRSGAVKTASKEVYVRPRRLSLSRPRQALADAARESG